MTPSTPPFLLAFNTLLLPLSLISAIALIWLGHRRARRIQHAGHGLPLILAAVLLAWFVLALALGRAGFYAAGPHTLIPTLPLGLFLPLGLGLWATLRSARIRAWVSAVPLGWLIGAQYYRAGGVVFLILLAGGYLPWQFALPAGAGDVLTGIFAILIGLRVARSTAGALPMARAWNLFGIFDLVVAVSMGTLTSPGITGLIAQDAPNLLITAWPLVMIPTFAVPLSLILHGLTAWKIREMRRSPTG